MTLTTLGAQIQSAIGSISGLRRRATLPALALLTTFALGATASAQSLTPGGPVDFGSIPLGSTSLNLTLSFSANVMTTITAVTTTVDGAPNKDYAVVAQTCTGTLFPGNSCNVTISFTPSQVGLRRGALSIADSSGAFVNRTFLHGIGLGAQLVYSPVSAASVTSSATLSPAAFKTSAAVLDGLGNVFFNDYLNGRILERSAAGVYSLVTTLPGTVHTGMALNGAGTIYVSSPSQGTVQVINPGLSSAVLSTNGVALVAPAGVAIDALGNIYIADSQSNRILRVLPDGSGSAVLPLTGLATPLSSPYGLAADNTFLYIADSGNNRIVEVNIASGVATALTNTGTLSSPYGIAVDAAGNLIVANAGAASLVQVSATGTLFPLVADFGQAIASAPLGVAITTSGDLIASDATLGLVSITRSTGSLTFPIGSKIFTFDAADGYETLSVQNSGNQAIQFAATDPAISATTFTSGPTNTCPVTTAISTPLAVGATCTYTFGFTPTAVGPASATVTLKGTAVTTGAAITSTATLNGTGLTPVDTLIVTASPVTTTPGVPVSFTVTAQQGTVIVPGFTGTVTFTMTDATGKFLSGTSYTFTAADAGTHTFLAPAGAQFNSPGTFTISAHLGSVVGTSNTVLVQYPATITLTSSTNPVFINVNTTLTATVGPTGTTPATGIITFYDGLTAIGTCTLSAGACTLPVSFTTPGSHSLTAFYPGDANYTTITSTVYTQVVTDFVAQVAITSTVNPSFINQQTVFTATVSAVAGQTGATTPTGTVTFKEGTVTLGTVTLVNGVASIPDSFAIPGNHYITAIYSGNTTYGAITPPPYTQIVTFYAAVETVTSTVNPSFVNQQTVFTASITAAAGQAGSVPPTGTVTFSEGATVLGTVTLVNGIATIPDTFTTPGNHLITVTYSGDANYAANTLPTYTQVVTFYGVQVAETSTINPSLVNQTTTLTATVSATAGQAGAVTPTGSVNFFDGAILLGSATLVNGVITLPATFTTPGNHSLTIVYSGDANYPTTTSTAYIQVVMPVGFTSQFSTFTSSINPSAVSQSTTLTAAVIATAGQTNTATPTGTVTFKDGATVIGTGTLVNGVATVTVSFLSLGNHPLTAVYNGDTNFAGNTSGTLIQVVTTSTSQVNSFTSSINPSLINQSTTFTVTIGPTPGETGTPTGTVTFKNGNTILGTAPLVNGVATLPYSFPNINTYPIVAIYSGDTIFAGVTSGTLNQIVDDYTSQTTLTSSINPSSINQLTTLTANVSPTPGEISSVPPSGTVTFKNGTTIIGTATLVNGVATLPTSFAATGSYPLTAVYSGDTNFTGSTSAILIQVVSTFGSQVTLTSSINPSTINQSTTFTATVAAGTGVTGQGTPTGTITFKNGTTILGTVTLVNGVATVPASFANAGSYPITAIYSGDSTFIASTSATLTQVVNTYASQVTLTSSINPSAINQSTTFTATVAPGAGVTTTVTPTGSVTFKNGATVLGTVTLVNGVATLPASFANTGSYPITAVYIGDTFFTTSTSAILTQVVSTFGSQVTLTSSINPSGVNQSTTFTATVAAATGVTGEGTPTGSVTFKNGATILGAATLVNGVATLPISFANTGSYPITAVYSSDTTFNASTSAILTQVVTLFGSQVTLTSSINPSLVNQSTTFTATVAAATGVTGAGTPAGTVTFYNGATVLGTATLVNGVATLPASFAASGSYPITAVYNGNTTFSTSTSAILTQLVNLYTAVVTLNSSLNPSTINQSVTFTATVAAPPAQTGASTPTGTITFKNGATTLATINLVAGAATASYTFTAAGSYPITAVYSGSTVFVAATSAILTQVVNKVGTTSTLTVTPSPVSANAPVTLTVVVTPTITGTSTITGTVTFYDGATVLGTVSVGTGTVALIVPSLPSGTQSLTCVYSGDANFSTSSCTPVGEVVNKLNTTASLSATPATASLNQTVTLTAAIAPSPASAAVPTGTVTFYDGATALGTVALSANGVATLSTTFTTSGGHALTCVYSGDANFNASTCGAITETVNGLTDTTSLTSSINPSGVNQSTTFTATVIPTAGQTGATTPTGTITFKNGATILGTAPLINGVATLPSSFAALGSYPITAVFGGSNTYSASTSSILTQVVSFYTVGVTLTSSSNPDFINTQTTLTATIAAPPAATAAPTGTVTFLNGVTSLGTANVVNGVAILPVSFPFVGTYSITAVYSGDANFTTATSPALPQVVEDFSIATAANTSSTATVVGGYATSYTFTITPVGGATLAGPIVFSLSGFPPGTVATFTPSSLATGASATNVTLTVKPPPLPQASLDPTHQPRSSSTKQFGPIVLALLFLPLAIKRRRRPASLFLWLLLCGSAVGLTGCITQSSSGYYGNSPVTSTLTVTASSGSLAHATTVTLITQ